MSFLPFTELSSSSSRCLYIDCNDCLLQLQCTWLIRISCFIH